MADCSTALHFIFVPDTSKYSQSVEFFWILHLHIAWRYAMILLSDCMPVWDDVISIIQFSALFVEKLGALRCLLSESFKYS